MQFLSIQAQTQKDEKMSSKDDMDNHANQLNPNNDAYWQSRGCEDGRPDDWEAFADRDFECYLF